jgi:hypothetical protein
MGNIIHYVSTPSYELGLSTKVGDFKIVMSAFFGELIEELIKRLDLEKVALDGLRCLSINGRLIDLPHIKVAIDSMIIEKSNALILK